MFAIFFCVSQELCCMLYFRSTHPLLQQIFRYLVYLFQVISVKKIERYKLRLFPTVQRLWSLTAIFWDRRRKMESIFSQKSSPMSKPPKGLPTTTIIPNLSNPYLSKYSSINLKTIIFQKYIYYYLSTKYVFIWVSQWFLIIPHKI